MKTSHHPPKPAPEIIIVPDRATLAREAAKRFVAIAREAIDVHGRFAVALSGGSTPRELYALLATPEFVAQIDWTRTHLFWGDERAVPPDHPDCNYGATYEALIAHVSIPPENVSRIPSEKNPDDAAREYEQKLREFFGSAGSLRARSAKQSPRHSEIASSPNASRLRAMTESRPRSSALVHIPSFDLVLLGLGADGHTASLFPHTRVLHETQRWVAAEYVAKLAAYRITLTPPIINAAKNILWLVAGADKAETVRHVLRGAYRPDDLPAQLIQPANGKVVWLLDDKASEKLKGKR